MKNVKIYDHIVIGAGVAGATLAHELHHRSEDVLVLEKNTIASGGSGAAGAFVSPKIGLDSTLHKLTNEAFLYAVSYYEKYAPLCFSKTGVVRLPKDANDADKFPIYELYNHKPYEIIDIEKLKNLGIKSDYEGFYFPEAGDCDAPLVCKTLLKDIEVKKAEVQKLTFGDGHWQLTTNVGLFYASHVVLATGYENALVDMSYMGVQGVWGTRGDFRSDLKLEVSMHQSLSVGANKEGFIKIGATHERETKTPIPCQDETTLTLKEKASSLIDVSGLRLEKSFCGMRAGAKDYAPLVGGLIDVSYMLSTYPSIKKGQKKPLKNMKNLYVFNGLGGRGFVFAPLLAKWLVETMLEDKVLDKRVNPDRLFWKWCRKL